jgi:hypothetical protein
MRSFIRLALILAGVLAASAFVRAQTPPAAGVTNAAGPKIKFDSENYDFGRILVGDPVEHTFRLTNTGDETLVLSSVKPTCGCTAVSATTSSGSFITWSREVAPGQSGIIPIRIETLQFGGQNVIKYVTVTSNDKARPVINLQIHGHVRLPIEVTPSAASFDFTAGTSGNDTRVLKIFNRTDTPLTLFGPRSTTNVFSAVLKTNVPGQEFELTVTAAPPSALTPSLVVSTIHGNILLASSITNQNPLQIGVFETVRPEITLYPPGIQVPAGPLAQALTNPPITIRGNAAPLTLSGPAANVPGVDVSVVPANGQYYLYAVFPKGFQIQPGQNIVVTVNTDNPRFPVLSVPVTPRVGVITGRPAGPPPRRTGLPHL